MNNQQKYLAWLRTTAPEVYAAAIRKVLGQTRSVGGLSSNLANIGKATTGFGALGDDISFSAPDYNAGLDSDVMAVGMTPVTNVTWDPASTYTPPAPVIGSSSSGGGFDWGSAIVKAVTGVATTVLNSSAQSKLLQINTTRASQGLPPVNAQGVVVPNSALPVSTNPTLRAIESSVGGTGSIAMIAGIGLLALLILKRK
jgi:hypothetical protein